MQSRRWVWLGVAAALTLAPVAARAQEQPKSPPAEPDAAALYQQGLTHYRLAEYPQAIEAFKAAYRLTEAPELLFNIAQAYRNQGAGHCADALTFYRNYARAEPDPEKTAGVKPLIAEMERCAANEPKDPAPPAPPEDPAPVPTVSAPVAGGAPPDGPTSASMRPWLPAFAAAVGVAMVGAGTVVLWPIGGALDSCEPHCDRRRVDSLETRATVGYALIGVGGAVAIGGAVWWFVSWRRARDDRRAVVVPTHQGVALFGAF